jgi:hypothetical protein
MSTRRFSRRTMPEAIVPYLRMSGRWLEEHGFVIGASVQVLVEHGRVTLISEAVEEACKVRPADRGASSPGGDVLVVTHEHHDALTIHDRPATTPRHEDV